MNGQGHSVLIGGQQDSPWLPNRLPAAFLPGTLMGFAPHTRGSVGSLRSQHDMDVMGKERLGAIRDALQSSWPVLCYEVFATY